MSMLLIDIMCARKRNKKNARIVQVASAENYKCTMNSGIFYRRGSSLTSNLAIPRDDGRTAGDLEPDGGRHGGQPSRTVLNYHSPDPTFAINQWHCEFVHEAKG